MVCVRLAALLLLSGPLIAGDGVNQPVTFAKDVAPILQDKCQECHRKGSMAPMSLVTYEETRPWAKAIRERVVTRKMPPWHLDKTVGIQHFQNDMSLTDEQIATIVRWVDAGAPLGDPKDMPPAEAVARRRRLAAGQDNSGSRIWSSSPNPTRCRRKGQDVWFRPLTANSADRAALGARRRDAAGHAGWPQDHASRAGLSAAGRTRGGGHRNAGNGRAC